MLVWIRLTACLTSRGRAFLFRALLGSRLVKARPLQPRKRLLGLQPMLYLPAVQDLTSKRMVRDGVSC